MLDHNDMIRVLAFLEYLASSVLGSQILRGLVKDGIRRDHVIDLKVCYLCPRAKIPTHHTGLGDLLGPKLALTTKVLSIIVAQVVVRRDREWLDARIDEELR